MRFGELRLGTLLTTVWLLASFVCAVLIEDAFKKDWIHYNYGTLSLPQLLDETSFIGLSDRNNLYTIDVRTGRVKSFIDMSLHGSDKFAVFESVIVTYSATSTQVSIFERDTGIFLDSIALEQAPSYVNEVFFRGLAILQTNGELVYWEDKNLLQLGSFNQKEFTHFSTKNKTFVFDDQQTIEISHRDEVSYQLVSSDKWKHYLIDKMRPESYVASLNDNYSVQRIGSAVIIAQAQNNGATESYRKEFLSISDIQVSKTAVAVMTGKEVTLVDLSEFLNTGRRSSVQTESFAFSAPISARLSETSLSTLSIEGNDVHIEIVDLQKKSRASFLIPLVTNTPSGKSILVDKPESLSKIDLAHHLAEETQSTSVLLHWLLRYKNHLSSLGKFFLSLRSNNNIALHAEGDKYGFGKILLAIDDDKQIMVATDSNDGLELWSQKINFTGKLVDLTSTRSIIYLVSEHTLLAVDLRTGQRILTETFETKVEKVFRIMLHTAPIVGAQDSSIIALKSGDSVKFIPEKAQIPPSQYFFELTDHGVTSFKLIGNKLLKTWSLDFPNENILQVTKNKDSLSVAAGISRSDRSVLYRFLNPNVVSVISHSEDKLCLRIIDGITGVIIHQQDHQNEKFDPSSVKLEQNDNWVVYSYLSTFPKIEQRVVVVDLFQEEKPNAEENSFLAKNVTVSSKAFIFPEIIRTLTSTATKFGITIKSLIALTDTGSLVEIPKFLLNSRRIDDRKMSPADYMDDFRLSPYEPVLPMNPQLVLNHKNKILLSESSQEILVLPTDLESSTVVCVVNDLNEFCTIAQPSSSYDLLLSSFDKFKLIITLAILLGSYIATRPFVHSKKLNAKWID